VLQFSVISSALLFFSDLRRTPDHERVNIVQIRITDLKRSLGEIVSAVKAAFENQQMPDLESGAVDYTRSKSGLFAGEIPPILQ
jgi:hypothetical protein